MTASLAPRRPAFALIVTAASFGFVAVQLDVTIVNVALASIGGELGAGMAGLQWTVDAYTLMFAALLLSAGALGDRIGPKRAFLAGFLLFGLSSAACGLATSTAMLIGARAVQGASAALLVPPSLALLNHACGENAALRARAVGWWTAAGGVSIAAGPVIGGLLIAAFGWRSIFLVNLPVCALGALLAVLFLEEVRSDKPRPTDLVGQGLAFLALVGLVGAVIEAGRGGLASPATLGLAGLGVAGALGFLHAQARVAHPILPLAAFRKPVFSLCLSVGLVVNLAYYGVIFVLGLYLQRVLGYSVAATGLAFLPLTATFIASNLISGWAVARFGSGGPMVCGLFVAATGYALLLLLGSATAYVVMLPVFLLIPGGMGVAVPAMTTALLSGVERAWAGTASGVLNATRQAGGAVGVAAFGAWAAGEAPRIVSGLHLAGLVSAGLLAGMAVAVFVGRRSFAGGASKPTATTSP